jgi:hypothetical protein
MSDLASYGSVGTSTSDISLPEVSGLAPLKDPLNAGSEQGTDGVWLAPDGSSDDPLETGLFSSAPRSSLFWIWSPTQAGSLLSNSAITEPSTLDAHDAVGAEPAAAFGLAGSAHEAADGGFEPYALSTEGGGLGIQAFAAQDVGNAFPVEVRLTLNSSTTVGAEIWIDAGVALENIDLALRLTQPSAFAVASTPPTIDVANFSGWNAFLEPDPETGGQYLLSAFTGSLTAVADPPNPIRFVSFQINRLAGASALQISVEDLILNSTPVAGVALFELPLASALTLSAATATVAESAPSTARKLIFDVQLDRATVTAESLAWALERVGSTDAVPLDFDSAVQGSMTLAAGQSQARIEITIKDDAIVEADERFQLRLSQASAGLILMADPVSAQVTVVDDDRSVASIESLAASTIVEGNEGSTVYAFEIVLDQAPASAQTVSWSVVGSGAAPADGADFLGGALPSGSASFAAGETRQRVEIRIAGDTLAESNEGFTVQLNSGSSRVDLSSTRGSISPTIQSDEGAPVIGKAYHWKSHALISDVDVIAIDQRDVDPSLSRGLDLRQASFDPASGQVTVELWLNPQTPIESFDIKIAATAGSASLEFISALDSNWVTLINDEITDEILVGSFLSNLSFPINAPRLIGTVTVEATSADLPPGIDFLEIAINGDLQPDLSLGQLQSRSNTSGVYALGREDSHSGEYKLTALRALDPSELPGAITSADAMAALKLALGRNPNADPDGPGPLQPLPVSPYQWIAADIDRDGKVTRGDAQEILRIAQGRPAAAGSSPDWILIDELADLSSITGHSVTVPSLGQVAVGDVPQTRNLVGLLRGDIDGNWDQPISSSALDRTYFVALAASYPEVIELSQFGINGAVISA